MRIRALTVGCLAAAGGLAMAAAADQAWLVKDGRSNARIVIAENPPRMVALAAAELRDYIKKISGAELAITNVPGNAGLVNIYVGRSAGTETLVLTDEGLKYGAFRMKSGPDYLVLLGQDRDFAPKSPWAKNNGDIPRAQGAALCYSI